MTDKKENKTLSILVTRKPQWENGAEQNSSAWLVSFTDVVALMLTFFVLLYAMSDPVQDKWEEKLGITPNAHAEYSGARDQAGVNEGTNIDRVDYNYAENMDYVEAVLAEILSQSERHKDISYRRQDNDLEIKIHHGFFDENGNLKRRSMRFVRQLSAVLGGFKNQMTIFYPSSQQGQNSDVFTQAQIIGRYFQKTGYRQPINIALRGDVTFQKETLRILIAPHDGRRITR